LTQRTAFLNLFRPLRSNKVKDTIDGLAEAMDTIDTFAATGGGGGGGGGFVDGPSLFWDVLAAALPAGQSVAPITQDDTALYAADGTTVLQAVTEADLVTAGAAGLAVGDDFLLQKYGGEQLWFKTPGLYVVSVLLPQIADVRVGATYGGTGSHRVVWVGNGMGDAGNGGNFSAVVGAVDVANSDLSSGATLSLYAYNDTADPQDLWITVIVTRVL
jgi:hypothetical protein